MWNISLRTKSITVLWISFVILVCCCCTVLADGCHVNASEQSQEAEQEYQTRYDNAVGLAELLRTSPDMVFNKLYTAEQEIELQALVDSVCDKKNSDRDKAAALLAHIFSKLEPGSCYELNGWDTLCDGENDLINTSGKTVGKKKAVNEEVYCFTFYDVCRLAGIPCFVLEDCQAVSSKDRYIAMVYIETVSGAGKEWYFIDVAAEQLRLVSRECAYETFGTDIYPSNLVLDYDKALYFRNVISLNNDSRVEEKNAPRLIYDSDTNTVKTYFTRGTLAAGEQYYMTEAVVGEDGVAPSGWIETKDYSSGMVKTYRSYAVCGVFLRGRVEKDGKEYELQSDDFYSHIPYYDRETVKSEAESEEHRAYRNTYRKTLENKAIKYAEALLEDSNYIWDDTNFSAEDETLLLEAVDTALNWEYITGYEGSQTAFETAGISLSEEDKDNLSDKAKAQAILLYIKRNVKSVDMGANLVNSAFVLRAGEGTCGGISLLYRDMCVMAGVPCFRLRCSLGMKLGDTLFGDHGDNLIKVGDEWLFCDPMNSGVIGKGDCVQLSFMEGYDTANTTEVYLDNAAVRNDNYGKWNLGTRTLNYFDFDSGETLGIYQRNRFGEPVTDSETDENGRYKLKNGLQTVEIPEMNEDGSAEIVIQYVYYYQNLRTLQGKKSIDGTEYSFDLNVKGVSAKCHRMQEVSKRYVISKLTFQPLEDQPYDPDGACPVPEIYHDDKKLEYGKDFNIVEYKHNKELTSYTDASYKVEGIGDYMGEATRYFKVVKADISDREVKLSKTSITWSPNLEYRKPKVDLGLTSQDYSVAYYDYNKVGRAKVVITGKGNYKGSVTKEYDIKPGVWNGETIQIRGKDGKPLQSQEFSYNFSPIAAVAKIYFRDENGMDYLLFEADDYEISYSGTEHPGTVTVTATAKGNYSGTATCTYKILPYLLSKDSISAEYTSTVYNKEVQKPAVTIGNFVEGKDYFVSYEKKVNGVYQKAEPKEVGEYRIVVRVSEDMAIRNEGGVSQENESDVCYISYFIQSNENSGGSGSGSSGAGGSGNSTGSSSSGTSGSGNNTGSGSSGTGGSGSNTGSSSSGTGSSGNSAESNSSGAGDNKDSETTSSSVTTNDKSYVIKKLKLVSKNKAIKISWSKVKKAKSYQIQISQFKNYKRAKTVNVKKTKNSYTFKKLKENTKYYIRIRVYKGTVGKGKNQKMVYGKWKMASKKTK